MGFQAVQNQQGPPPADRDLNAEVARSPRECRDGTATLDEIKAWIAAAPGLADVQPRFVIRETDLDRDGTTDLLIADDRLSGSAGRVYHVFLKAIRGFRYVGNLWSMFWHAPRPLPAVAGHPRIVMPGNCGAGCVFVGLAELRQDGLHLLALAEIAAGDQGNAEGNALFEELLRAPTVSTETLRSVFGSSLYPPASKGVRDPARSPRVQA